MAVLQLTNTILFGDTMDQITWVRNSFMIKWNKSNINHQPRFKLEFSCHKPDPESRKFPSRFCFSKLSNLRDCQWKLSRLRIFWDSNFLFLWDFETFWDWTCSNLSRPGLFRDSNLGFFETETFRDSAKIVETETFSRRALISASETHLNIYYNWFPPFSNQFQPNQISLAQLSPSLSY